MNYCFVKGLLSISISIWLVKRLIHSLKYLYCFVKNIWLCLHLSIFGHFFFPFLVLLLINLPLFKQYHTGLVIVTSETSLSGRASVFQSRSFLKFYAHLFIACLLIKLISLTLLDGILFGVTLNLQNSFVRVGTLPYMYSYSRRWITWYSFSSISWFHSSE